MSSFLLKVTSLSAATVLMTLVTRVFVASESATGEVGFDDSSSFGPN
jgi:hypothetical protein